MVRETRHLCVGNLPDNIREDRIREHFKRYGRVQNVKLLGRTESVGGSSSVAAAASSSGVCATVAFMDIKSASKAHNAEHVLDERTLTTEYYEPSAIPAGAPSAGSSPAGSGYSGSSVNSAPATAATPPAVAAATTTTTTTRHPHLSSSEEVSATCALAATAAAPANWRGTNDSASEYTRRGTTPAAYGRYPRATPPANNIDRTPHHRWYSGSGGGGGAATGGSSTPSTPGGGTESGRRRRRSGSGSSRSESSSAEPSDGSRASTPAGGASCGGTAHRHWAATTGGRPLAICVRNLPARSTDTSLKDGLYHEYKKHGKVVWVKVVGQNADRYAVVRFKKPSDVEKALEVSQDKLFFGCKISVAPHQSCDEDADSAKPYETDIDEYHPKATRTLFIGNLEKDVTQQLLRDKFKHFGRIIEIDIKKGSGGGAGYAFCQYAAISSVVDAIRAMDGEYVGGSRVKLGFGKPVATTCVWVDGLTETTEKQVLACVARCGAATSVCVDRAAGAALVHFEQAGAAGAAVRELRRVAAHASAAEPERPRLAVDYASRECQEAFYEQLEKHGGSAALAGSERAPPDAAAVTAAAAAAAATTSRYPTTARHDTIRYDACGSRSRASSYSRSASRTPRYTAVEHYDPTDYVADRRYRVYDELGDSPPPEDIALYEDRLQSVVVSSPHRSRRHRRDSSTEDRKHSKERHRSVTMKGVRRSRSGSRGGERHAGRRRHRRRCEGSGSRGSRAGTPLRDEVDAAPCEPRRGPRERQPRPMSLPLPQFALELLPPAPRPAPAAAPDSPPRPHSASSSSAGSAPHSPSIEERIRSLDEKLSGTRGAPETPDRSRLRHHLLDLNINEVKPSEVVRSLLAKRSVFDEDSERLEGAARAPSPSGASSPRGRPAPATPRALRYPFPVHPPAASAASSTQPTPLTDAETLERPADPRLNRPDRPYLLERLAKFNETDYKPETRVRLRTPSIDKVPCATDRWQSPRADGERLTVDKNLMKNTEPMRRNSMHSVGESEWKDRQLSVEFDSIPKRRDSIHSVRDALLKNENLPIESDSKVNISNSTEDIHIKVERSISTETDPEQCNSNVTIEETEIKTENILPIEADSKRQDSSHAVEEATSKKETQSSIQPNSKMESRGSIDNDHKTENKNEPQSHVVSEFKRTDDVASHETVTKTEKQWSIEAEEREIKEAIQKIDADNKDLQSLIHDDRPKQQTITSELHDDNSKHYHNKCRTHTFYQQEKQLNTSSLTLDISHKMLEQQSKQQHITNDIQVSATEVTSDLPKCESVAKSISETLDKSNKETSNESNSETLEDKIVENDGESDLCKDILIQNHINKELLEFEMQHSHLNSLNSIKPTKNMSDINQDLLKNHDKNGKERYNQNVILEAFHTKLEKENIQFDKQKSKDPITSNLKKTPDADKHSERGRSDREKQKYSKDRLEKNNEKEKSKNHRNEKCNSDKKFKEEIGAEKSHHDKKYEKETDKHNKDKSDKDKNRHNDEKKSRYDHHRKDKSERDDDKKREKKKDDEAESSKPKKEDKQHKHERSKKENSESKRDLKKDTESKSRKSSRDESTNHKDRDLHRKDSTDSSTSKASHDSKTKDSENHEIKDEFKLQLKCFNEICPKQESEKELLPKIVEGPAKPKTELKEDKDQSAKSTKTKPDTNIDIANKCKAEIPEKLRHYSLDSPNVECKRKERLNSSSSLPSNLGQKRRISSQDSVDSVSEDTKKVKNTIKPAPERRDSKDSRNSDRPKTTKFNKGHFAKIIESKTKDDKKNQVKPPDEIVSDDFLIQKLKGETKDHDENVINDQQLEGLQNDLDFLATLELRSSEEDERQKAIRKEMREKKRIQQLQQIQELQMQQDALQHAEMMAKLKDERKKCDDKKKEARDKRMSTERKSREDKSDSGRRKNRKQISTDSSDSDEPKKHSIFDVVDDEPAYISMYDKVKARSCKNMQKQEEEKRQEKIKAKFSQLKQSRAKREEKKRSSWDEDSDSEHERRKHQKSSVDTSTDDEHFVHIKKCGTALDFERNKINNFFSTPSNEEDSRNKLSRKNSRSRIISDTSDDDGSKRSFSKSPSFFHDIKKEFMTEYESLQRIRGEMPTKESSEMIKKNSILNLFGKSDSDDNKLKSSFSSSGKSSLSKTMSNDLSSEGENVMCNRILNESRKRHKKKQKKHKYSFSDDDCKIDSSELGSEEILNRRHSAKKEKRKDRVRDSIDTDEIHDERIKPKKDKKFSSFDMDSNFSNKKEGRMEDIFGPISDDSDRESTQANALELSRTDLETFGLSNSARDVASNNEETKAIEDAKIRKEKRRKEKKQFLKDDENSLDVDAVSKEIEARLFADATNDDNDLNNELPLENVSNSNHKDFVHIDNKEDRHNEKIKRECKKKKKKKNREDRMNRRDHHNVNHHHVKNLESQSEKSVLLDIPLPMNVRKTENIEIQLEKHLPESVSLPRLTDSPPTAMRLEMEIKNRDSDATDCSGGDNIMDIDLAGKKVMEVDEIPMPPTIENVVKNMTEVSSPLESVPEKVEQRKVDPFLPSFDRSIDVSEDAVRSISNIEKDSKTTDKLDNLSPKSDKKSEEKPRAVISQEETEDAVAALLGESFGEKDDTFDYEEVDSNPTNQIEIESSTTVNENIPEEDAEEMRQAVQNLNACEMEIKPDTPVSDNDLLLIDTDTEEVDDTAQDGTGRLPANVITTSHSLTNPEQKSEATNIFSTIQKPLQVQKLETKDSSPKIIETDLKIHLSKQEPISQVSCTATPVITSYTLTNNKLIEPHVVTVKAAQLPGRENEIKPTHISANIVQIHKAAQNPATLRPTMTPYRGSAPYQVINHVIRPQAVPGVQPPTIKIPEPHILYQRPQSIVISPRMSNDPRLHSPKVSPQGEGMSSPRLANVAFLSTSPQNLNSLQQRSPGQVTVVRMQQPPLSPIQAYHLPPGARTLVSPNRPNSVLVQTQGAPIHLNRLPVTPVLAPISKQIATGNIVQSKATGMANSPLFHQQKITVGDCRRNDHRLGTENSTDHSTIILAPTSLQHSTNPTVMAQNRLISMQNAGNLHLNNKILANDVSNLNEKRECLKQKAEQHNHISYSTAPIIRVAGVNQSTASIIHSGSKPIMSTIQDSSTVSRGQGTNVIHTFNSQRLVSKGPISNMIQIDPKNAPSVLSMATIRPQTVLTKFESPNPAVVTSKNTNIVMAPLLLKTSSASSPLPTLSLKNDATDTMTSRFHLSDVKDSDKLPTVIFDRFSSDGPKDPIPKPAGSSTLLQERMTKCETDFEELLKDNTNEIKITNNPDKQLEVNVGKTVTTFPTNTSVNTSTADSPMKDIENKTDNVKFESVLNTNSTVTENKSIEACTDQDLKVENSDQKNIKIESDFKTTDKAKQINGPLLRNSFDSVAVCPKITEFDDIDSDCTHNQSDSSDNQIKGLDENDSWSAKDVNIESVIKKVDSLCNDTDTDKADDIGELMSKVTPEPSTEDLAIKDSLKPEDIEMQIDGIQNNAESGDRSVVTGRRGGRSTRGRKIDKIQDRVQTRQIAKPNRGGVGAKRGRGRAKVDKKIQNLINNSANNLPGDVYDFHEDSGDETSASLNKNETRPRLILTIKSPVTNSISTPTLTIAQKDEIQPRDQTKIPDKDDKSEEFMSPSINTRKSRRLQEKDVQRSTVDDVIEDVVKGSSIKSPAKDNKKRQTRQTGIRAGQAEKGSALDTRKSPRGVKRTRDRSLSDASADSNSCPADGGEEKMTKKEETSKAPEPKISKLAEPPVIPKSEPDPPQPAKTVVNASANVLITVPNVAPTSTLIMKPPKKMISEISAKLAGAFEAAASATARPPAPAEAEKQAPVPRDIRNPEFATAVPAASELMTAATGDATVCSEMVMTSGGEAALSRRLEAAGAAEPGDARVQSPALPHRPAAPAPGPHRPGPAPPRPDRAIPHLIRGGEGEGASLGVGGVIGVGVGAGAGGMCARPPRPYAGPASLPRGAHHPPALPPAPALPALPSHHHHPGAASRVSMTSIPSISPQGQIGLGEGMYPHFSHQHYQMYQQHFRATQHDARATPSPYSRTLEAEGCEAPTPPLELRRPPSARVPRPAHSPSPADRLILYGAGCGRSPPPAHGTSRLPGALPPAAAVGPPHASQVPREADSLQMLLQRYPVMWQGLLALKNDSAAVQMHFVGGNMAVAGDTLPRHTDGSTPPLRIAQRMRLEPTQLDQVHRKMKMENEHCILLALPCGRDHMDVLQQSTNLTAGFITYLQRKQAAGIVNVAPPGHQQALYTVHIFPSCEFANENLTRIAPDLMHRVADIAHLLIVIATV